MCLAPPLLRDFINRLNKIVVACRHSSEAPACLSLLKLQKSDVECPFIGDDGCFRRCVFVSFARLPTPLAENKFLVVFALACWAQDPQLHSALFSVVPTEVLQPAEGSRPVMLWS